MGSSLSTSNNNAPYQQIINEPPERVPNAPYQQIINEAPERVPDFTSIINLPPHNIYQEALTYQKSDLGYFFLMITAADRGYEPAQNILTYEYVNDMLQERKFFQFNQEFPYSCYCLGKNYQCGFGVEKNVETAMSFYEKGLKLCHAIYDLAEIYRKKGDYQKAYELNMTAVDQDYGHSINAIGLMYYNGEHVEKDIQKAQEYYHLAIKKDIPAAMYNLGQLFLDQKKYSLALEWLQRALDKEFHEAAYELGKMYRDGNPFAKDVGVNPTRGKGVEKNHQKALELFTKGAELGSAQSRRALGIMYHKGEHVPKNNDLAFKLFKIAVEQGDVPAKYWLATAYYHGNGTEKDYHMSSKLFQESAGVGHVSSIRTLGCLYGNGQGVIQNYNKAIELLKSAIEKGSPQAIYDLSSVYIQTYREDCYREEIIKYFFSIGHPEKLKDIYGYDNYAIESIQKMMIFEKELDEMRDKCDGISQYGK